MKPRKKFMRNFKYLFFATLSILLSNYTSLAQKENHLSSYNKATSYKAQFKFDSAIYYYNISFAQAIVAKDYKNAIQSSLSLADMYYVAGTRKLALEQLERAKELSLKKHLENSENYAHYCDLMGKIYLDENAPDFALTIWQQSLYIRKQLYPENDIRLVRSYTNFLTYYYVLFDVKNSSMYVDTVSLLLSKNKNRLDSIDVPEVYNALARSIKPTNNKNRFKKAEIARQYLTKGILYLNKRTPINYNKLGQLYHTMGNTYVDEIGYYSNRNPIKAIYSLQKASKYYDLAIASYNLIFRDKHENIARSYFVKGLMYQFSSSNDTLAIPWFRKAFKTASPINGSHIEESISSKEDLLQSILYHEKSLWNLYAKTGKISYLQEANFYAQKRVAIWEKMMYEFQSERKNDILNKYNLNPLPYAARFSHELYLKTRNSKYLESFFEYSEKSKYYSLAKSMQQGVNDNFYTRNNNLIKLDRWLVYKKNILLERRMINYYSRRDVFVKKQSDSLEKLNVMLSYIEECIQNNFNEYYSAFKKLKVQNIKTVQELIPDKNSAIIEYYTLNLDIIKSTISITITKDTFFTNTINWSKNHIDSISETFQESIQTSNIEGYSRNAFAIYDTLLRPAIAPLKNINRLIIIPDPSMSFIPFDGLISEIPNPKNRDYRKLKYLIHKYQISTQLSANMMIYLNKKGTTDNLTKGLFVSPEFKTKMLSSLPFSEICVNELSTTYSGKSLQKNEATKSNFIKNSDNCNIIHLSTHSNIDNREPLKSKLFFSQYSDADTNNYITLEDIYNTRIKANLVVLNACETNQGYYENGEGLINFPRAFLMSGSKSVLSTLWKTDDKTSSEVISIFYDELNKGLYKDEALRNAKLNYLNKATSSDDANPLYWASSVIIGNNQPIHLSNKDSSTFWYYLSGIVLLSLIIGFVLKMKKLF